MKGICLSFYTSENHKHEGMPVYEWLLEFAKQHKIKGGSAFRGIAGYGRHGILHEEHFFELAPNVPVEIIFILSEIETETFLDRLKMEAIDVIYTKTPVEYGTLNNKKKH